MHLSSHPPSLPPAPGALHERVLAWRDRLLASTRFRRLAIAFAPTRPLARAQARELFDLMAGFVYSQVLLACVRLDLFGRLAAGPLPLAALARDTGLSDDALRRLLDAAVSLRLLQWRGQGVGLGPLGATLCGNQPLLAMVEHHATLYADLADPLALLRGEVPPRLNACFPYAGNADAAALPSQQVADYSALMSASQPLVAQEILDRYDVRRHKVLLDVGGGEGTFLLRVARHAPQLQLRLFDLPAVAERASARFLQAGLGSRAQAHGGDFRSTPLPAGADLATLLRVAHDHPDASVLAILKAIHAALVPGGRLLLAEPMAGAPGAEPVGAAYFGMYLLAMGSGRARTAAELTALLHQAGFARVRPLASRLPLQVGLLLAERDAR